MTIDAYVEMIEDFCRDLEIEQVAQVLEQGVLQIDDTLIGIEYLEERDEVRLLLDLGGPPLAGDSPLLTLMLQANLGNTSFCLPTFSLHPKSGHPVMAYHVPLAELMTDGIDLASVVQDQLMPVLDVWHAMVESLSASGTEVRPDLSAGSNRFA